MQLDCRGYFVGRSLQVRTKTLACYYDGSLILGSIAQSLLFSVSNKMDLRDSLLNVTNLYRTLQFA